MGSLDTQSLTNAYASGDLIIFAGPGVSRAAGLPDDEDIARQLLAHCEPKDAAISRELIDRGAVNLALEHLCRRLGRRFHRVVEAAYADEFDRMDDLPREIARLRKGLRAVYTTSLDRVLERAFAGDWPAISSSDNVGQRRKIIFKVRGTLQKPASWILTERQLNHELLGTSSRTRETLCSALRSHRVLFVGFEQRCPLLEKILLSALAGTRAPVDHHIILETCDPARRIELEDRGIAVIVGRARDVLAELAGERPRTSTAAVELPSCPYPGLSPFDLDMKSVFFGREFEVSEATSLLGELDERTHCHWLSIEGPSGVGKSSFALAGVVPAIQRGFAPGTPQSWVVAVMRPGPRPVESLARVIAERLELDAVELERQIREEPEACADWIERSLSAGHGLLLVVDQLEELSTEAADDERRLFEASVAHAVRLGRVYLVTTMRTDFVSWLVEHAGPLTRLSTVRRYELAPITRIGLRDAIIRPAALAGVRVSPELVEQILAAFDGRRHPSCELPVAMAQAEGSCRRTDAIRTDNSTLPLVAHVIWKLWRQRESGDLCADDCEVIGGLEGALDASANETLDVLDAVDRSHARALLLELVNVDHNEIETRHTMTRAEAVEAVGGGAVGNHVLMQLSSPKGRSMPLIVVDHDKVDLVHEALLRHWRILAGWLAHNREARFWTTQLRQRARVWVEGGRSWRDIPSGREQSQLLRARPGNQAQRDYHRALRMARTVRRGLAAGVVVGLALLVQKVVQHEQMAAEVSAVEAKHDRAATLIAAGEGERAQKVLVNAYDHLVHLDLARSPLAVENQFYRANLGALLGSGCEPRIAAFHELTQFAAEVHGTWSDQYGRALHDAAGNAISCRDYDLARIYAERCVALRISWRDTKLDSSLLLLGQIALVSGVGLDTAQAMIELSLALADDDDARAEIHHARAQLRIVQADALAGQPARARYSQALDDVRCALELEPLRDRQRHFKLAEAWAHGRLGDYERAVAAFDEALEQAERNFGAADLHSHWKMYVCALKALGRADEADRKVRQLRASRPHELAVIEELGRILQQPECVTDVL